MVDTTVRQFLKTPAAVLSVGFMVAMGALAIFVKMAPWRDTFDPAAWNDPETEERNRQEMADDLVARGLLDGLTRSEVTSLLGQPPDTEYFRDWDMVYVLGPERSFIGIDFEWLVVRFGDNDRVSEYRIVTD
jgi:hypothetical protein